MANQPANIRPNPAGDLPQVDPSAYVDPSAQIIGNVRLGAGVFVGPCAVVRADEPDAQGKVQPVVIGEECNLQDGVIIHAPAGGSVSVGARCSLAHGSVVHGPASLGPNCFLGIRAVLIGGVLEEGVWVGVGATILEIAVPAFTFVPGRSLINTSDKVATLSPVKDSQQAFQSAQVTANLALANGYRALAAK
jgi:carbonic anhydrase/acetyltransferase-like protein (isoleucine patch superfamily)